MHLLHSGSPSVAARLLLCHMLVFGAAHPGSQHFAPRCGGCTRWNEGTHQLNSQFVKVIIDVSTHGILVQVKCSACTYLGEAALVAQLQLALHELAGAPRAARVLLLAHRARRAGLSLRDVK